MSKSTHGLIAFALSLLVVPAVADLCDAVPNVNCVATDMAKRASAAATAAECCSFCQGISGCKAWTWKKADGSCIAKSGCDLNNPDTTATSGYLVAPLTTPPDNQCTVGLTFRGTNGTRLDFDYLGQGVDVDLLRQWSQFSSYYEGPGWFNLRLTSALNLHYGCNHPGAVCHDDDIERAKGKWVFVNSPGGPFTTDFHVKIVAICRAGCPEDSGAGAWWLKDQAYSTVWEFIGEVGKPGMLAASASCCTRKPQQCDALYANPEACEAECAKHSPLKVWSPLCSTSPCCEFVTNQHWPIGDCMCYLSPPPTVCDHGTESSILV